MSNLGENTANQVIFSEKLVPAWSSFVAVAILWPSVWLVFLPINATLGAMGGAVLTAVIWGAMVFASPRIVVDNNELCVGRAHIPLKYIGFVSEVATKERFAERGSRLDARAFVRFQAGIKGLVKIELNDANDPTPYWLLATRKPQELISALKH